MCSIDGGGAIFGWPMKPMPRPPARHDPTFDPGVFNYQVPSFYFTILLHLKQWLLLLNVEWEISRVSSWTIIMVLEAGIWLRLLRPQDQHSSPKSLHIGKDAARWWALKLPIHSVWSNENMPQSPLHNAPTMYGFMLPYCLFRTIILSRSRLAGKEEGMLPSSSVIRLVGNPNAVVIH